MRLARRSLSLTIEGVMRDTLVAVVRQMTEDGVLPTLSAVISEALEAFATEVEAADTFTQHLIEAMLKGKWHEVDAKLDRMARVEYAKLIDAGELGLVGDRVILAHRAFVHTAPTVS